MENILTGMSWTAMYMMIGMSVVSGFIKQCVSKQELHSMGCVGVIILTMLWPLIIVYGLTVLLFRGAR